MAVVNQHYQARAVNGIAAKAVTVMNDADKKAGIKQRLIKKLMQKYSKNVMKL